MPDLFPVPAFPRLRVRGSDALYPVTRVFCVGRNYAAHAAEMGNEVDRAAPFYFTKTPLHVAQSGAVLPYPQGTSDYHHEMEFMIAIGTTLVAGDRAEAEAAIFGYGAALDMTRRDLQALAKDKRRPWDLGKDVEASAVLAALTPKAAFGPVADQRIHLTVNGRIRQDATLAEMIHDCPAIVADLSRFYTLGPGDVILTGTPAGVGPVSAGDVLYGEVAGCAPVELTLT